jgi:hypothetical protein
MCAVRIFVCHVVGGIKWCQLKARCNQAGPSRHQIDPMTGVVDPVFRTGFFEPVSPHACYSGIIEELETSSIIEPLRPNTLTMRCCVLKLIYMLHTHTHACTRTQHTHTHACMCTCKCVHVIYIYISHACMCTQIYICTYIYIYIYMYISYM